MLVRGTQASQHSYSAVMENLWSDSRYEVSVRAMNELGWGREGAGVVTTTSRDQEQLQSLALELISSGSPATAGGAASLLLAAASTLLAILTRLT